MLEIEVGIGRMGEESCIGIESVRVMDFVVALLQSSAVVEIASNWYASYDVAIPDLSPRPHQRWGSGSGWY